MFRWLPARKMVTAPPTRAAAVKRFSPFYEHPLPVIRCNPGNEVRDDYLRDALKVVDDPNILVNVVSRRVKQLRRGNRPLIESLEKLSAEDTALREIAEGKISYELATPETLRHGR